MMTMQNIANESFSETQQRHSSIESRTGWKDWLIDNIETTETKVLAALCSHWGRIIA